MVLRSGESLFSVYKKMINANLFPLNAFISIPLFVEIIIWIDFYLLLYEIFIFNTYALRTLIIFLFCVYS